MVSISTCFIVFGLLQAGIAHGYDCSDRIFLKLKADITSFIKSGCNDSNLFAPLNSDLNEMTKQTSDSYFKKHCKLKGLNPKLVTASVGNALNFALFPSADGGKPECIKSLTKALKLLEVQSKKEVPVAPSSPTSQGSAR